MAEIVWSTETYVPEAIDFVGTYIAHAQLEKAVIVKVADDDGCEHTMSFPTWKWDAFCRSSQPKIGKSRLHCWDEEGYSQVSLT